MYRRFTPQQQAERISNDRKNYEQAKVVFDKFLEDIKNGIFGWDKNKDSHGTIYLFESNINLMNIRIDENKGSYFWFSVYNKLKHKNYREYELDMTIPDKFEEVEMRTLVSYNLYINEWYYRNFEKFSLDWDFYHNSTFKVYWRVGKRHIKKYLNIDLDERYGES
jgi:hypothetical protein